MYTKEDHFHILPNVERATIIYEALRGLGFRPKQGPLDLGGTATTTTSTGTKSSATATRAHNPSPMPSALPPPTVSRSPIIAPSSKAKAKTKTSQKTKKSSNTTGTTPRPSPTTVAETGSMTMPMTMPVAGHHRGAAKQAATGTAKARAQGIPKLPNAGRSSSKVATAKNRDGNGRFASGKTTTSSSGSSIVPTPIAHHAAITALRIATNSAKKKTATGADTAISGMGMGMSTNGFPYGLYTGTTWSDTSNSGGSIRKQHPAGSASSAPHFSFGINHMW